MTPEEQYPDEESAIRYFEARRWPDGIRCPRCESADARRIDNKARRRQLFGCHGCNHLFTVTSGTIMESTKLPLRTWLLAFSYIDSKSALALSKLLDVSYNSALALRDRIKASGGALEGRGLDLPIKPRRVLAPTSYTLRGESTTIGKIAAECKGATAKMVGNRLRAGRTPEQVIAEFSPVPRFDLCGEALTLQDLVALSGHTSTTVRERIDRGAPILEAIR